MDRLMTPLLHSPDPNMRVNVISQTPNPQTASYLAMHQDYSEEMALATNISESKAGEIVSNKCLKFGHWGVIEHPQIHMACGFVPHSVMQQFRTHRNASFDVQSFRYTEKSILKVASHEAFISALEDLNKAIYFRPVGYYTDRNGAKYTYNTSDQIEDFYYAFMACRRYAKKREKGFSEEHCRGMLPFDYRQHFHLSGNLRAFLHVLDLRAKKNAQLESQWLSHLIMKNLLNWVPEIGGWYLNKRYAKATLSP